MRAIVVKGNFLAPICSQLLSVLSALNHSSTFIPVIIFLPVGRQNRLANVLRARRVFVSFTFESVYGNDQSQAVRRASGVQTAPNAGETVARIRAMSSTDIIVS